MSKIPTHPQPPPTSQITWLYFLFSEWISPFAHAVASQHPPVNPAETLVNSPLGTFEDLGKTVVFVETNPVPGEYAFASV